jgi:hypothetical protein
MDIWGRCPDCATWFPCEGWFDREVPEPTCPSCDRAPTAIENRAVVVRLPEPDAARAS